MRDESSQWFTPVPGDEHILLGRDSPLRRIPVNIRPKQAVFLDGLRHATEVMDVGFSRLRHGLTRLALEPPEAEELPLITACLFLDAWAVVDAIDRFRQLYLEFPGMTRSSSSGSAMPLREALQTFRDLRNVGDHLAQRSEQVVAKGGGAALGELDWLTGAQLLPQVVAWHCVLRPGTLRTEPTLPTAPIETTLDWPTDRIRLSAGGYEGNLSQVRTHIAGRVRHLEAQLSKTFSQPQHAQAPVMSDFFGRRPVMPVKAPGSVED